MSQFSIDAFRANLINGIARNNLFLVQGSFPGANTSNIQGAAAIAGALFGGAVSGAINAVAGAVGQGSPNAQVSFLCKATKLPTANFNIDKAMFMGREFKYPGNRTFNDWSITCYNDGSYGLRKAFEAWQNLMGTNRTNVGPNAMNQFMTDWSVTPLTREGNPMTSYKLVGCFPASIGDVTLDMAGSAEPSTFEVTIAYQYFEVADITT